MRVQWIVLAIGLVVIACGRQPPAVPAATSLPTAVTTKAGATTARGPAAPFDADLAKLARQVISTTIGVHPGDVVVVDGGTHTIPLMEQLAIESQKAGGMPMLWLESAKVARSFMTEVPDKYLDQKPAFLADWYRHTTVWIGLGSFENDKDVFADVPEAKLAKIASANQVIMDMLNASPIRGAVINYPTSGAAAAAGLPFERYAAMQWAGVGADYNLIAAQGRALKAKLEHARQVHITTPAGTDLRFSLAGRPVVLQVGIVSQGATKEKLILNRFVTLPGGNVEVAPVESSVTGVLVVPRDQCKFKPLREARYEFSHGTITQAKAGEGNECLQDNLRTYGAPLHRLGSFGIGLNPAMKVVEDRGDFRPYEAAGEVTLRLGDNQFWGGSNVVPGGVNIDVPVTGATVELDGVRVVEHGALVGPATASATP